MMIKKVEKECGCLFPKNCLLIQEASKTSAMLIFLMLINTSHLRATTVTCQFTFRLISLLLLNPLFPIMERIHAVQRKNLLVSAGEEVKS